MISGNICCFQEIYKDRKKFSEQVFKVASSDLVNMGISVVSYTLKDVHDDQVSNFSSIQKRMNQRRSRCNHGFLHCCWSSGLSALAGKSSDRPGPEGRSHRRGSEQERRSDQGQTCRTSAIPPPPSSVLLHFLF